MADWGLIVGAAAGLGTVTLGVFQYRLSQRQTVLFERQTALEEDRVRREVGPQLHINPGTITSGETGAASYRVVVRNKGASAAVGVYVVADIAGEEAARSPERRNIPVDTFTEFVLVLGAEQVERAGGRDAISGAVGLRAFDRDESCLAEWQV